MRMTSLLSSSDVMTACYLLHDSRLLGPTLRPSAPVCRCHRDSWTRGRLALAQEAVRCPPSLSVSLFDPSPVDLCRVIQATFDEFLLRGSRLVRPDQFTMWGKMSPEEILTEHVVDITELRQISVTHLKEISQLLLLSQMESTNIFLINHQSIRGSASTTGTLGPDVEKKMLSKNKLGESGMSLPYRKLLRKSNTKFFVNCFT